MVFPGVYRVRSLIGDAYVRMAVYPWRATICFWKNSLMLVTATAAKKCLHYLDYRFLSFSTDRITGTNNSYSVRLPFTITKALGARFLSASLPNRYQDIAPDCRYITYQWKTSVNGTVHTTHIDLSDNYGTHTSSELSAIMTNAITPVAVPQGLDLGLVFQSGQKTRWSNEATMDPRWWRVLCTTETAKEDKFMTEVLGYRVESGGPRAFLPLDTGSPVGQTSEYPGNVDRAIANIYILSSAIFDPSAFGCTQGDLNAACIGSVPSVPGENTFRSSPYPVINTSFTYTEPRKLEYIDFSIYYMAAGGGTLYPLQIQDNETVVISLQILHDG